MATPKNWLSRPVIGNARVRKTLEEIERRGQNFKPFYRREREPEMPALSGSDIRPRTEDGRGGRSN